jgi:hypothetical protein
MERRQTGVTEVTLKATGLPLQSARYTVENPPELSGARFLIWSRGTSRAGAALGRRGLAFAPAEPEEGSGVAGMGAAGTEGGGGGRAACGVFGCEGSAVATDAEEEGTGAGSLGGGGGAAVWTTLGLALREKRDRDRER